MAKMWCINCQREVENFSYCASCGGNCQHRCTVWQRETMASIVPNQNETGFSLIRQMVGEAQRKAKRTGQIGDIEVSRTTINSGGEYYCQILVYNTQSGNYRSKGFITNN